MRTFCTITPTRGDRPQLLEFCKHQLSRMTVKPEKSYFIDYKPMSDKPDLSARIQKGIELAKADGFDQVFVIEDDDYYPADYFERMWISNVDFIGNDESWYYHIHDLRYQRFAHPFRSSLFHTGFKISALEGFKFPDTVHVDIDLWKHAQKFSRTFKRTGALGIKHGIGHCAGIGHFKTLLHDDKSKEFLKENVDHEAYIFYQTLRKG